MNEEKKKAIQVLKTARGQIDGIIKMIEEDRYCMDVTNQIFASQALLKRANILILKQHLDYCVAAPTLYRVPLPLTTPILRLYSPAKLW